MADTQTIQPQAVINQTYDPFAPNPGSGIGPVGPTGVTPPGTPIPQTDTYGNPTGQWIVLDANGRPSPYRAPTQSAGDTSAQVDGAGVPYIIRGGRGFTLDGQPYKPVAIAQNPHPGTSYSYGSSNSTSQNFQDPAALEIQREQNRIAKTEADARIRQIDAQMAQATALLDYTKQKDAFGRSQEDRKIQLQAEQQASTASLQLQTLGLQRQGLVNQQQALQAQLQMQAASENARNEVAGRQIDQQAEQQRQQNLLRTNEDIATFSANPTDAGKAASFMLANSGWGQAGGAAGQADLTSDKSLQPLAGALNQRTQLQQPITPTRFTPIVAPTVGALDVNGLNAPVTPAGGAGMLAVNAWNASHPTASAVEGTVEGSPQHPQTQAPDPRASANAALSAAFDGNVPSFVGGFKDGGMANGAFIAGEGGGADHEELVIPLGPGQALVLNKEQQAKMKPAELKRLKKMADGGIFSGGSVFNTGNNLDTTDARQFQQQAFSNANASSPWASGGINGLPTATYASSPGSNQYVNQLLASLNALGRGTPTDWFLQQAQQLAPTGYSYNPIARQQPVGRSG